MMVDNRFALWNGTPINCIIIVVIIIHVVIFLGILICCACFNAILVGVLDIVRIREVINSQLHIVVYIIKNYIGKRDEPKKVSILR